jgi:hypothetical protein
MRISNPTKLKFKSSSVERPSRVDFLSYPVQLRMETKPPRVTGFEDFTLLIKC